MFLSSLTIIKDFNEVGTQMMEHDYITYLLLALMGSIIIFATVFLFVGKYHMMVVLNVLLLPVALIEPSPSDVIFVLLLLFFMSSKQVNLQKLRGEKWVLALFYSYIFINIASFFYISEYLQGLRYLVITVYLISYSVFISLYVSSRNYVNIVRAYVIGSTFSVILGFLGYLGVLSSVFMYDALRMKALFKDPNVFGPFLVPTIITLLDDVISRKKIFKNSVLSAALIFINSLGVLFSFSRAAWVSMLLSVLVYFVLNLKKINHRWFIGFCLTCVILLFTVVYLALDTNYGLYIVERARLQSYDMIRFQAQRAGIGFAFDRLAGYGPGQYEGLVSKAIGIEYSAHSLYIRVVVENGVLGLAFLLMALIYVLYKLFFIHLKVRSGAFLDTSVLIAVLVGVMVSSVVIDTIHWRHFWLFVGLGLSVISDYNMHKGA